MAFAWIRSGRSAGSLAGRAESSTIGFVLEAESDLAMAWATERSSEFEPDPTQRAVSSVPRGRRLWSLFGARLPGPFDTSAADYNVEVR